MHRVGCLVPFPTTTPHTRNVMAKLRLGAEAQQNEAQRCTEAVICIATASSEAKTRVRSFEMLDYTNNL